MAKGTHVHFEGCGHQRNVPPDTDPGDILWCNECERQKKVKRVCNWSW